MLGIVIPAHNEAEVVDGCLHAAVQASRHPQLAGEEVCILVVLDSCSDETEVIVSRHAVHRLAVQVHNVGVARAAGAEHLLRRGARWLAFTDADTRVAPDWLAQQLALRSDAVCGTFAVEDWSSHGPNAAGLEQHFRRTYFDTDGNRHVHGANLGVSAQAYRSVGGFPPLTCGEDVALVTALEMAGARIAWSARPRVVTSARPRARAPDGFAAALRSAVAAMLAPTRGTGAA